MKKDLNRQDAHEAAPDMDLASPDRPFHSMRVRVASDVLLQGSQELLIDHAGEEYRLRKTNKGKLILTK